jgi:hypothetical protein
MSRRTTSVAAWVVGGASLLIAVGGLILWAVSGVSITALAFPDPGIALTFPLVGAVIASKRPENPVGWIMLAVGLGGSLTMASSVYGDAALLPGSTLPGGTWADWISNWAWAPTYLLLVTVLIPLFPDGRPASRRRRLVVTCALLVVAVNVLAGALAPTISTPVPGLKVPNPLGVPGWARAALGLQVVSVFAGIALMIVCVVGLVRRFRASHGVLRLQLSWFTFGFVVGLAFMIVNIAASGSDRTEPPLAVVAGVVSSLGFGFVAVAVGIAVFRYRLYAIDRIVSRTISYFLLTALLVGVYALIVVGIGTLTGGSDNPVLIAGATLLVAAMFGPLRRRVQAAVDRRFNRRRYDAERVLGSFSSRLRDELDLDALAGELVTTASSAVQPATVGVWIRDRGPRT